MTKSSDEAIVKQLKIAIETKLEDGAYGYLNSYGILPGSRFDKTGTVISNISLSQSQLELDDFKNSYPETNEDNLSGNIESYVDKSYDDDYITTLFERVIDMDELLDDAKDEIRLEIVNTEPYANTNEVYIRASVNTAPEKEIFKATSDFSHNGAAFIENYLGEWQENQENDD